MDLVILTPLALEYHAFQQHLINTSVFSAASGIYETGQFIGQHHTYTIAIRQTGPKNSAMALAAEKAIQTFQPKLILLGGIAGGVKDVAIGDVVIATKAYGYESGKETAAGFQARPEVYAYDTDLIDFAQTVARNSQWQKRKTKDATKNKVFFGPIAAGDKVIASTQSPIYHLLKQSYNDTIALDMEAIGFAQALESHREVRGMNIRGISDLLDHKSASDQKGTQEVAAANAAAFTFEWLYQLDFTPFKPTSIMDSKTLLQKILTQIFPLLNLKSVQKIGSEFRGATDTTINEIWEKVRPIFIEEIVNVGDDIEDEATQEEVKGAIKAGLRKAFRKDASLQQQITALLEKSEQNESDSNGITISHSKNIMQGNQITGGGQFHIGDVDK